MQEITRKCTSALAVTNIANQGFQSRIVQYKYLEEKNEFSKW